MMRAAVFALWICIAQTSYAEIFLTYVGPPIERGAAPPLSIRATIRLPDGALGKNDFFGDTSDLPGGQETVVAAVVSDGIDTFDYKNPKDRVEISLTTDARGRIVRWQLLAERPSLPKKLVVLGPGRTNTAEGSRIPGGSQCPGLDLVIDISITYKACAVGQWTVSASVNPPVKEAPRLFFAGNDVTGATLDVVAGQKLLLSAVNPSKVGGTWRITGNAFGGYSASQERATASSPSLSDAAKLLIYPARPAQDVMVTYAVSDSEASVRFRVGGPVNPAVSTSLSPVSINKGGVGWLPRISFWNFGLTNEKSDWINLGSAKDFLGNTIEYEGTSPVQ